MATNQKGIDYMTKYSINDEDFNVYMQRKFDEARPHAIQSLVDIYKETDSLFIKKNAAFILGTRINVIELKEIADENEVDFIELILYTKEKLDARRRAKEKAAKETQRRRHEKREDFALTKEEWAETLSYFDSKCAYCGEEKKITYDHFVPFSKGGSFTQENLIPACKSCNSSKHSNDFEKWYHRKPYYSEERYSKIVFFIESFN